MASAPPGESLLPWEPQRAVQQCAGIVEFELTQTFGIDVDDAAVEVENLHAIAGALGDPLVDFLRLAQRLFAALARGDVGVGSGHVDGGPMRVSVTEARARNHRTLPSR